MTAEQAFPTPAPALLLEARQMRVITQTITRPGTTFIAVVTLGDPTATPAAPPPPPPPPAPPAVQNTAPAPSSSSSALNGAQLGAVLGSVLGFFFLALLVWCCVSSRRRRAREIRRHWEITYGYGSEEYTTGSESDVVRPGRPRRWSGWTGGGGEGQFGTVYSSWPRRPDAGFTTVPPPVRLPPTPRYTSYRQTAHPQISGVRRFP
ncbi:hypothetical protein QBC35DRAFT_119594 [Podospora australis]|uniref:Transmembrane protein n=1 Tax=Podospora australis TaxID=1536484 RepID=A0AAN6WJN0_9PEZI|nr:hypothetical protein QBC35DRAFT_119594 [Podospora australis]